ETRENQATVSAAAECAIDVGAFRLHVERSDRFFEEDRRVLARGHSEKPSSSGGRLPAAKPRDFAIVSSQFCWFHSSNFLPCPTSTTCLSSCAYSRRAGEMSTRPAASMS